MFRSIWSKSLREYRTAILGWGLGLALFGALDFAESTPTTLAAFGSLAPLFRFLGDPYQIQTPEGFITWRIMGLFVPLAMSFWPILAGARLVREEEERGSMDVLLSTPQSRMRLLLSKLSALLVALILIGLLFALGLLAGQARLEGHANVIRALLAGLNLSLLAFFFGCLALLFSQFTTSRAVSAGWASGLLLLSVLLDSTGRLLNGSWVQYLSPFYYYNLNRPLVPGFPDQPQASVLLASLALLCVGVSLVLFARRDIGRAAFSWQCTYVHGTHHELRSLSQAERALSTRNVSLSTLRRDGWSAFWWGLGVVFVCVYCLVLALSTQQVFYKLTRETPLLQALFFDTPTNSNAAMLGTFLFTFMPAIVVIFALTLALKWSADLENGRLEVLLSTPQSRLKVLLSHWGTNVLLLLVTPLLTWFAILMGAQLSHLAVDQGRIFAASFNMFPMALITIGLVYALAGRLRYSALVSVLSAYIVLSYMEELFEGAIPMPVWLMNLSIFHLYGNPVFLGVNWTSFLGMTGVALLLLGVSLLQFRSADIKLG
ncbi:MAG TPA: ABC transporter permease subunit [Ktedonobacteraceae bacterium]|nr:ABC transporter permease subunit [Ktedonobacteraceae bacterium]